MSDSRLVESDIRCDGEIEGLGGFLFVEPEEARRGSGACHAPDGHVIEAEGLQIRFVADPAEDLVSEHGRNDHVSAAAPPEIRRAQDGRNAVARMPGLARARVPVVVIEEADHDAVGERREIEARPLAASDDAHGLAATDSCREIAGDACRFAPVAAQSAAEGIGDEPLRLCHDFGR